MPRDLVNPLLLADSDDRNDDLEERESAQLLNPSGFDPCAALLGDADERAA